MLGMLTKQRWIVIPEEWDSSYTLHSQYQLQLQVIHDPAN